MYFLLLVPLCVAVQLTLAGGQLPRPIPAGLARPLLAAKQLVALIARVPHNTAQLCDDRIWLPTPVGGGTWVATVDNWREG